ncbi:class I SAM-dependent methyltransferase [Cohnella pontilimi]|uniref:Class I SAM-dependent methyltransferase n=1 Tax=Cohnella pontilimi TaxID=2564100 RepID=A0A4U0FCT8_9BACL|nr:class I SAM-dependent methyltransferase [Cohnella pontilimi]TJY41092.1 class I SAM-dependent methyltransferase [Cohnella pontilimi]
MGVEWYDEIARRNGGYKTRASFRIEGISGEKIFEERLISLLSECEHALDAGCGHGDFTIRMSPYSRQITGFDNSKEMIKIAVQNQNESSPINIRFIWTTTKEQLPFKDAEFDLIYSRRGPTSIINHPRILKSGGKIMGIHSGAMDKVKERLESNGFVRINIDIFDQATILFPDENELAKFLSDMPGNIDYRLHENRQQFYSLIDEYKIDGGTLGMKEWRYIWSAVKP